MTLRPLTSIEQMVIRSFADQLPGRDRDSLLADVENASAETIANGSRIAFTIIGYERPTYRGQHAFPVEAKVQDRDGAELTVLLHADENGRLLELEIVRFEEGDVLGLDWSTFRLC